MISKLLIRRHLSVAAAAAASGGGGGADINEGLWLRRHVDTT